MQDILFTTPRPSYEPVESGTGVGTTLGVQALFHFVDHAAYQTLGPFVLLHRLDNIFLKLLKGFSPIVFHFAKGL